MEISSLQVMGWEQGQINPGIVIQQQGRCGHCDFKWHWNNAHV